MNARFSALYQAMRHNLIKRRIRALSRGKIKKAEKYWERIEALEKKGKA